MSSTPVWSKIIVAGFALVVITIVLFSWKTPTETAVIVSRSAAESEVSPAFSSSAPVEGDDSVSPPPPPEGQDLRNHNLQPSQSPPPLPSPRASFCQTPCPSSSVHAILEAGHFWNATIRCCEPIPGFIPALEPFEVSPDEVSCNFSDQRKQKRESNWVSFPFRRMQHQPKQQYSPSSFQQQSSWLFRQFLPWESPSTAAAAAVTGSESSTYHYYTAAHDAAFEDLYHIQNFCLSPFHGLFGRLTPSSASNISSRNIGNILPYEGKDDTYNARHGEPEFRGFFQHVSDISSSSSGSSKPSHAHSFSNRSVLFVPSMPLSRSNIGHTGHKMLTASAIIDKFLQPYQEGEKPLIVFVWHEVEQEGDDSKVEEEAETDSFNGDDENLSEQEPHLQQQKQQQHDIHHHHQYNAKGKPAAIRRKQLAFSGAGQKLLHHTNAWGMFLQALDLPWAVTLAVPLQQHLQMDNGSNMRSDESLKRDRDRQQQLLRRTLRRIKATATLTKHDPVLSSVEQWLKSNDDDVSTVPANPTSLACFRHGIVYQNCRRDCHDATSALLLDATGEAPSYSFGNFVALTHQRRQILRGYVRRMEACLPPPPPPPLPRQNLLSSSSSSSSNYFDPPSLPNSHLPRFFFHVRSFHRGIKNFATMIDAIQREVVSSGHFGSEIVFREPYRGSRAAYLNDLRGSDIFVGTHSGAFTEVVHMRSREKFSAPSSSSSSSPPSSSSAAKETLVGHPVVVEFAAPWSSCLLPVFSPPGNTSNSSTTAATKPSSWRADPRCWHGAFSSYVNADHWVLQLPKQEAARHMLAFHLSPAVIVRALREAACRWLFVQFDRDEGSRQFFATSQAAPLPWCRTRGAKALRRTSSSAALELRFARKITVKTSSSSGGAGGGGGVAGASSERARVVKKLMHLAEERKSQQQHIIVRGGSSSRNVVPSSSASVGVERRNIKRLSGVQILHLLAALALVVVLIVICAPLANGEKTCCRVWGDHPLTVRRTDDNDDD